VPAGLRGPRRVAAAGTPASAAVPQLLAGGRSGLPVVDHGFVDSFALDVDGKTERYVQLLRELPAGLSEWAVHPAVGQETPAEAGLGWAVRCSDHDFLLSDLAHQVIDEEGIIVVGYRGLQQLWRAAGTGSGA